MFLDLMKKYQEQFGIKVFAFCLMPDHLHLLVEVEKQENAQPISDFMHGLNNNYTKYFNGRYERKGHLFRERFKSGIIEKESHLLKMTAYLHLNPQRLGAAGGEESVHSSYQVYLADGAEGQQELSFMRDAVNEALGMLHTTSYADFVKEMTPEEGHIIHKRLQRGGILGSDEFIKMVKDAVQEYQESGELQKYELDNKKNLKVYFAAGALLLIFMVSAGAIFLVSIQRNAAKAGSPAVQVNKPQDLNSTQWQVKLASAGQESADVLSFTDGAFVSAFLNGQGFPSSNFSVSVLDNGTVVWETMQTSANGTASWHGEIAGGKMTGVLSLRVEGKEPQDFSFISLEYRRKK